MSQLVCDSLPHSCELLSSGPESANAHFYVLFVSEGVFFLIVYFYKQTTKNIALQLVFHSCPFRIIYVIFLIMADELLFKENKNLNECPPPITAPG